MNRFNRTMFAAAAVIICSSLPGFSAEKDKVKLKGSTDVELPRSRTLESKVGPVFESEGPGLEGALHTPPPQVNPRAERKLREARDKERNWIFRDPSESFYDSKTERIFGLGDEDETTLLERGAGQESEKTLVEKFIMNKQEGGDSPRENRSSNRNSNRSRDNESDPEDRNERGNREDRKDLSSFLNTGREEASDAAVSPNQFQKPSFLTDKSRIFSRRNEDGESRNVFSMQEFDSRRALIGRPRQELNLKKEETNSEGPAGTPAIETMLQPREIGSGIASRFDPVNMGVDSTRQPINPITASRFDAVRGPAFAPRESFLSESPGAFAQQRDIPTSSSIGNLIPQAPALPAPTFGGGFNAPSAISPSITPRPFVFEIPKRAF